MTISYTSALGLILSACLLLSGCANRIIDSPEISNSSITQEQRTARLLAKKHWNIRGKIAFIQQLEEKDKRESASLIWQVNEKLVTQELNLTSYLGINVLHLKSNKQEHTIKVDGKEYRGSDLTYLIYSLTGLTIPTQALTFWLKSLPYNKSDNIQFDQTSQLPTQIASQLHGDIWQIHYDNYRWFDDVQLATKFTIMKEGLEIKVAIKNWRFID